MCPREAPIDELHSCRESSSAHQRERDQEIALLYPSNENELKKKREKGGKKEVKIVKASYWIKLEFFRIENINNNYE